MITIEKLRYYVNYDQGTGVFTWANPKSLNVKEGDVCGASLHHGYIGIRIEGKRYYAHRLAWMFVYGQMPDGRLDHINRKPSDNRICNLRQATQSENRQNASLDSRNKTGRTGVSIWKRGGFRSEIGIDGRKFHLGIYPTLGLAIEAREFAESLMHRCSPR